MIPDSLICRTWIVTRFLEITTSSDADDIDLPSLLMSLYKYKYGVEVQFRFTKYLAVIYLGYQHIVIWDEKDGIITSERER